MDKIKIKYTIETGKGIVEEILSIEEIEAGKLSLNNYSMPRKIINRTLVTEDTKENKEKTLKIK